MKKKIKNTPKMIRLLLILLSLVCIITLMLVGFLKFLGTSNEDLSTIVEIGIGCGTVAILVTFPCWVYAWDVWFNKKLW